MRLLSTSLSFSPTTSLARSPAPYATESAVWYFKLGAAAIRSLTSSRLNTTGSVRGTNTCCIFAISAPRSSVTPKKNLSPVMVALSVIGEAP